MERELKRVFSVGIFHDIQNKVEFLFLAEFFRLCGIFVGEILLSDRVDQESPDRAKQDENDECFSLFLCIGRRRDYEKDYQTKLPWDRLCFTEDLCLNFSDGSGHTSGVESGERFQMDEGWITSVLNNLRDSFMNAMTLSGFTREESICFMKDMNSLSKIFIKHDLLLHSMNLQFYRFNNLFLKDIEEKYYRAYRELKKKENNSAALIYAMLFCGYKANDAAILQGKLDRIETKLLVQKCYELLDAHPEFLNARVLLGLIFSINKPTAWNAIQIFKELAMTFKHCCFASHIHYWEGYLWETVMKKYPCAKRKYIDAYQSKKKYRNMYRIAYLESKEGNYKEAVKFYEELLQRLQIRMDRNFMDPLELEYCYVTNLKLGDIYHLYYKDYNKAIAQYEKAVSSVSRSKESLDLNTNFYSQFYGEEYNRYRELTKSKIDLKVAYRKLRKLYQELQLIDRVKQMDECINAYSINEG